MYPEQDDQQQQEEPPPPPKPVDPALLQKAIMRFRNNARGNGLNPHTILLDNFEGETLEFEAKSLFEIKATRAEKHLPGKETHGIVCASELDMHNKVKQAVEKTTVNRVIIRAATDFLEHRKDKGFLVDNLVIKLDRLNKTFIFYNSCTQCSGSGRYNCQQCQGVGQENCPRCHAHRTIVCPMCRGTKVARQKNGQTGTCPKCHGHGEAPCTFCQRTGKIRCKPCQGSGRVPCPKCAASGIISTIIHVSFEGRTKFLYDKDALPEGVSEMIDLIGPDMAAERHADITTLKEKEQRAKQDEYRTEEYVDEFDELVVPFDVALPFGPLSVRIGPDVLPGTLFGLHPLLHDYPAFLERPIAPGLDRLNQAANNLGRVRGNLSEAIRFRALGDALVAAATLPPKKAVPALRKRWTLGLRDEVIDLMALQSATAFANVTKFPRYGGLVAGLLATGGFFAAWLAGPLRGMVMAQGVPPLLMVALDALLIAAAGYLTTVMSQLVTRLATNSLFRQILPPDKAKKIMPRAGKLAPLAYGGAILAFLGVMVWAWSAGHPLPEWAQYLLRLTAQQK